MWHTGNNYSRLPGSRPGGFDSQGGQQSLQVRSIVRCEVWTDFCCQGPLAYLERTTSNIGVPSAMGGMMNR